MPIGGAPTPRTPTASSIYTGFTPKHAMTGFNFDREQNTGKSAKDAFASLSNNAPPPPTHDKNALAIWFRTYIQPGMQDLGHNVTEVDGDKFRFNNWQGDFWVDYTQNAGLSGSPLSWQADYAQGGPGSQAYSQTQQSIMGIPRSMAQGPGTSVAGAITAPLQQPHQEAGPDMAQYYQYLQSLMQGQESI